MAAEPEKLEATELKESRMLYQSRGKGLEAHWSIIVEKFQENITSLYILT